MIDAATILNYLSSNKARLVQDYHLSSIGIFGSVARGEQSEDSDIDLVVEFEPGTPDLHSLKSRLKDELHSQFERQVDICRLKYIKPIFREQIQSEIRYA